MKKPFAIYLLTGSTLLALGLVLLVAIFNSESFAGRSGGTYEITLAAISILITGIVSWLTWSHLRKDRAQIWEEHLISGLRFIVSTVMLGYAFTKLHHGHMYLSYASLDSKLNDLSDFETVWSFYGRYSAFQTLIGFLELIPALLLLFRRSALAGAALMLPVISNVVILNTFYHIGGFTLPVSVLVMACDLYIIYSFKPLLVELITKAALVNANATTPSTGIQKLKRIVKFIPASLFGLLILMNLLRHQKSNYPTGGFQLRELVINNLRINNDSLPDDIYRKIYFEKRRIQSSLVNHKGWQGAAIDFYGTDSIRIMYRNGPLDMYVPDDTTAIFTGRFQRSSTGDLILKGKQKQQVLLAVYEKIPLKEFDYWWEN